MNKFGALFIDSEAVLLNCNFMPGGKHIISSSMEGDVNILSVDQNLETVANIDLEANVYSNIVYCANPIRSRPDKNYHFLVGQENQLTSEMKFNPDSN